MIIAIGWCILRTSRDSYSTTDWTGVKKLDEAIDAADEKLWASFREWMAANNSPYLLWTLHEHHNNHNGVLQVFLSRNHRGSPFWDMLEWIATNGPASYGLFYVNDDEDIAGTKYSRDIPEDYDNVFRVHRIMNGRVDELVDPFFGPMTPNLEPIHPYDRATADEAE